ncbi:hypothetical protein [Bifidobacterium oedipodis]|nr:hypothetical protein [Bifidobacterium sp. DSM 109957]
MRMKARWIEERLERIVYAGDDRDIEERYVSGRLVPKPFDAISGE